MESTGCRRFVQAQELNKAINNVLASGGSNVAKVELHPITLSQTLLSRGAELADVVKKPADVRANSNHLVQAGQPWLRDWLASSAAAPWQGLSFKANMSERVGTKRL